MSRNRIIELKKELGLDHLSDEEVLKYALDCSQEIKRELLSREDRLGYSNLINSLGNADGVILKELNKERV